VHKLYFLRLWAFWLPLALLAVFAVSGNAYADERPGLKSTFVQSGKLASVPPRAFVPNQTPTPVCPPSTSSVLIVGFGFSPQNLDIYLGQTVRWTNLDPAPHSSTSDTSLWDSGTLAQNDSYEFTFNSSGVFPYHCTVHPTMTGIVRVVPACAPTSTPVATNTPVTGATRTPTHTATFTRTPTITPTPRLTSTNTSTVTSTPTATATCPPLYRHVKIQYFHYSPQSIFINVGETVIWTNADSAPHTSTSDTLVWNSGPLAQGQTFAYTFNVPGGYSYHCSIHPGMVGHVLVRSGCAPTPYMAAHVSWQGASPTPGLGAMGPITVTTSGVEIHSEYPEIVTDASGFFTLPLGLSPGHYRWRAKGPKHLANAGEFDPQPDPPAVAVEIGLMRGGDANDDNIVSTIDFSLLRASFGKAFGDPGFDERADFNSDNVVNSLDFSILRSSFGQAGAPPLERERGPDYAPEQQSWLVVHRRMGPA
jgi:plastocyanin